MVLVSVLGQATEHSEKTKSILRKDFILGASTGSLQASLPPTLGLALSTHKIGTWYLSVCDESIKISYVLQSTLK